MPANRSIATRKSTTVRARTQLRWARAALHAAYILSEDLGANLAERLFTSPRRYTRPARERTTLATARAFEIDVTLRSPRWSSHPRTRVAAWRWGIGPTVLLIHGWEGRGSQLGALVEPLLAAGLSVVTFDAPAHGDSPGSRLYLTDHADAIADVVAAIGPIHATVAHSFGAAALLLAHQRSGIDITRNVAVAPNVVIADAIDRFARSIGLDETDRSVFEHQLVTHSGVALSTLTLDRLAANRDAGLVIFHDPDDPEVPFFHGEALAAAWPGAQLRAAIGLGHRRVLRDPSVIGQIVAYVAEGLPQPASDLVREVDRSLAALDA